MAKALQTHIFNDEDPAKDARDILVGKGFAIILGPEKFDVVSIHGDIPSDCQDLLFDVWVVTGRDG